VDGIDGAAEPLAVRARIGMLSDARGLYGRLTARENIRYYGALRGLAPDAIEATIARLSEWLDMEALLERRTDGFSQGERMKVAIARILVHDPPNVVLDEPTNGLDVMTTRSLREVVRRLRDAGKCVLFSSHVMQEVSALCDAIVIMARIGTSRLNRLADLGEILEQGGVKPAGIVVTAGRERTGSYYSAYHTGRDVPQPTVA